MSLFPPKSVAEGFRDIEAVRVHYGVRNEVWAVPHAQLGMPDMRIFSALPPEALVENVMFTRTNDGASLNPTQAVQIGLVWRLCRRLAWMRGGATMILGKMKTYEDPWAKKAAPTPATSTAASSTSGLKERGIKMSSIIDQSDDSEFHGGQVVPEVHCSDGRGTPGG